MEKVQFVAMAAIQFSAWRLHPGYQREGAVCPTHDECVREAEALWDSVTTWLQAQQSTPERR